MQTKNFEGYGRKLNESGFWSILRVWIPSPLNYPPSKYFGQQTNVFFQRLLEHFLCGLHTFSTYLKGAPNLVLCVSKKFVTVRRTNQIARQEKQKSLNFQKMKLEYFDKT